MIIPFTTEYYFSVLTLSFFKHELTELHLSPASHHIFGHTSQQSYDVRMRFKLLQQVQFRQKVLEIGLGRFFYNSNIIFICVKWFAGLFGPWTLTVATLKGVPCKGIKIRKIWKQSWHSATIPPPFSPFDEMTSEERAQNSILMTRASDWMKKILNQSEALSWCRVIRMEILRSFLRLFRLFFKKLRVAFTRIEVKNSFYYSNGREI